MEKRQGSLRAVKSLRPVKLAFGGKRSTILRGLLLTVCCCRQKSPCYAARTHSYTWLNVEYSSLVLSHWAGGEAKTLVLLGWYELGCVEEDPSHVTPGLSVNNELCETKPVKLRVSLLFGL